MIKAILLAAFVPFLTQHRNITPSNEVSTCFYGSVTGIVDNAYIAAASMSPVGVTNIANAVVASSNLCTVAAARAMTNGLLKASYPNYSGPSEALYWNGSTLFGQMCNLQIIDGNIKTSYGYFDATHGWGNYRAGGSQTLPQYIESEEITNGGAKAYADATFLPLSGGVVTGNTVFNKGISVYNPNGIAFGSTQYQDYVVLIATLEDGNFSGIRIGTRRLGWSPLKIDGSPFATSNMVERVIASKGGGTPLSGRVYDFDGGSNFTKRVYAALTNVIQTLGGTVTNAPAF